MQQSKLRISLEDTADAMDLVRADVYEATGLTCEVEFQEIEAHGELVLEVRLPDSGGYTAFDLATMVAAGTRRGEVLSAWVDRVGPLIRRPVQCRVMDLLQCEIPDLALRAHRDGVPTARWHGASPTRSPHWLLAVPGIDADRRAVVGICRRSGYYYRFSAGEAASVVLAPVLA